MAFVLAISPPAPGSEAIVPHQAPSCTVRKIERRCSSQALSKGGGASAVAVQKFSTACMAQTKATDESPWASVRSISQIGRAD